MNFRMKKKLVVLICYVLLEIAEHVQSVEFECEKEGFAVVQSENCRVYYYCVKSTNDEFFAVKLECPLGEGFSLLKLKCIPEDINECGKLPETPNDDPILLDEFLCPSSGRFPDVESPDCKSYYVCSSVLVPVLNKCPSTTIFSWVSMKCVVPASFTCPNAMTTTTEATTTTTEVTTTTTEVTTTTAVEATTQDPLTSERTETVELTTEFSTTDTENQSTESETTTEHNALTTPYTPSFICTSHGRFSDPDSTDCKRYYLCIENTEGFLEATLNQCPSVTIFYPETGKCVLPTNYQCPTVETTTSDPSEEPSTVEPTVSSTEAPTEPTTSEPSTPVLTTDAMIPTTATSATDEPTPDLPGESFACTESGRFPDPKSTDCKGYYLCIQNTEGFFKATLNRCPSVTIFQPDNGKCVQPTNYQCPGVQTTTPDPTEEPSTVETTVSSTEASTEPTTSEPSTPVLTTDVTTPTTATSATDEPTPDLPGESFVCTEALRVPDPISTDCKSYYISYLCTNNTERFYKVVRNRCPSVTIFNPENGNCVQPTNYQCPTVETTTPDSTVEPSTVESTVSSTEPTTSEPSTSVLTTDVTMPTTATSATDEPTPDPPGESFACTESGRFPDPKSIDCKGYYLCIENTEGFFKATLNRCPSVTIFYPETGKCVQPTNYQCPTVETTTPDPNEESSTVEPTVSSTEAPTAPTTSEPSTPVLTTDVAIPTTATSATDEPTPDPPGESFVCTESGRFPDPKSTDCKGYYLCIENTEGFFKATLNRCPSVTIFYPETGKCVQPTNYQCPTVTTTTPNPTEEPSTVETTVSSTEAPIEPTTSESSTPVLTTDVTIPTTATSATEEPTPDPPGESFACTESGRFPDPKSTDCKGYYLCTENTDGFFEATLNQCPSDTIFHPENGKCVQPTNYQCPTVATTTPNPTEEPSTVETTVSSTEAPTEPTTSEPSTPVVTTDVTIHTTATSATDEPTPDPPGESFACLEYGRFPDPKATDCKSYYLCIENTDGFFEATLNRCPSATIFHPENGKCVQPTNYQCPTVETTTSDPTEEPSTVEPTVSSTEAPTEPTTPKPSTPVLTTQSPPTGESFVCTATGRFPDPTSTDCKGYYLCTSTVVGAYQAVLTQCPSITVFSAEQKRCVLMSQYQCTMATTTPPVEPTTQETTIPTTPSSTTSPDNFICTTIGRHPDPTQPDCSTYKYCLLTATNEFLEFTFNCPSGFYFNPLERRCSMGYSCPALSPTAISEATTELPLTTTPFYCTSDGRFPDPASEGCDTYIMCLRTAVGSFQTYNFKCPGGSLFSPTEAKCSSSYLCI